VALYGGDTWNCTEVTHGSTNVTLASENKTRGSTTG
jgi:hypothetical protein